MCRFTLYLGPPIALSSLITEPTHSLIRQSLASTEREEPVNGDGFGVAWYVPSMSERPAAFRSVSPAWSNGNLIDLCRVTKTHCMLAHVRAATPGIPVTETNCHPFTQGRFAMMHNGDVGGFTRMRRRIISKLTDDSFNAMRGTTDSEHLFAMFLDAHAEITSEASTSETIAAALEATLVRLVSYAKALKITEPSYLNIAVADGHHAVAARCTTDAQGRADSLYVHTGRRYVCEGGVCRMISPTDGTGPTVIVSSEPLSTDAGWSEIPVNHLVLVGDDRSVTMRPCAL